MHAYDPSLDSQQGILLFRGKALDGLKSRKDYNVMVDILPTILTTVGLDVPTGCEGKSLVQGYANIVIGGGDEKGITGHSSLPYL